MTFSDQNLERIGKLHQLLDKTDEIVIGKRNVTAMAVTAMLAGGHVLFEDIPGVGKTLLVKTLARTLGADFSRIQFTPDLVPSDIIGFSMPTKDETEFIFRKGPIFTSLLLADEINRTSPRTQAAMLEAMAEGHVTMDGFTYRLPTPFFVLATQNPIEYEGTYPLPEAQLDRFLMQLSLGYPTPQQEIQMLLYPNQQQDLEQITPIMTLKEFQELKNLARTVFVRPELIEYIVAIGNHSRKAPHIRLGISPRGNKFMLIAAQAYALLQRRAFVTPDDIQAILLPVYRHRILFFDRLTSEEKDQEIKKLAAAVPVPIKRG